jgi:hypothetical protein
MSINQMSLGQMRFRPKVVEHENEMRIEWRYETKYFKVKVWHFGISNQLIAPPNCLLSFLDHIIVIVIITKIIWITFCVNEAKKCLKDFVQEPI